MQVTFLSAFCENAGKLQELEVLVVKAGTKIGNEEPLGLDHIAAFLLYMMEEKKNCISDFFVNLRNLFGNFDWSDKDTSI